MGFDSKYGLVETEHGDIPADEQVVVFRARDVCLPDLLKSYYVLCKNRESPERHLALIQKEWEDIAQWQEQNIDRVKVPDSEASKAWMEE
jgi:hypothetical protein